jgi:hypothetical protein
MTASSKLVRKQLNNWNFNKNSFKILKGEKKQAREI